MNKGEKLLKQIDLFRHFYPEMQAQTMCIFLQIARVYPKELPMTELSNLVGITQASCSRNVALLSSWTRYRTKGPGLIVASEDPFERRAKLVKLTQRGHKLYKEIGGI
jgi:DNA-binding MarR family transcriptional regulator|tara:strand:- start:208 stop:531 length:324 start_codon:yes stop_codon:yes gene_type:complete